jgi:plasmid stabilization system protein ParE
MNVRWTGSARADFLSAIETSFETFGPTVAERLFDRVHRRLDDIATFPMMGRAVPGSRSGERAVRVGVFRIVYEAAEAGDSVSSWRPGYVRRLIGRTHTFTAQCVTLNIELRTYVAVEPVVTPMLPPPRCPEHPDEPFPAFDVSERVPVRLKTLSGRTEP